MIHRDAQIIDLCHRSILNLIELQRLCRKRKERAKISVLHYDGLILQVAVVGDPVVPNLPEEIKDPRELAEKLYRMSGADIIEIFDRGALEDIEMEFYSSWNPNEEWDLFVFRQWQTITTKYRDRIIFYPSWPEPMSWFLSFGYEDCMNFLERDLPEKASLALGIFDDADVYIGLVWEIEKGKIVRITTFDHYYARGMQLAQNLSDAPRILETVRQSEFPLAYGLFCKREKAEEIVTADKPVAALQAEIRNGAVTLIKGSLK